MPTAPKSKAKAKPRIKKGLLIKKDQITKVQITARAKGKTARATGYVRVGPETKGNTVTKVAVPPGEHKANVDTFKVKKDKLILGFGVDGWEKLNESSPDMIDPDHYKGVVITNDAGESLRVEVADIVDAFFPTNPRLHTAMVYFLRCLKKNNKHEDINKGIWWLLREIEREDGTSKFFPL